MASGFEILWFVAFPDGFWIILVVLQKRTRFVALPDEIIAWLFLPDRMKRGRGPQGQKTHCAKVATVREPEDVDSSAGSETPCPMVVFLGCEMGKSTCCRSPVAAAGSFLSCLRRQGLEVIFFFFSNGVCVVYVSVRLSCSSSLDVGSSRSLEYK